MRTRSRLAVGLAALVAAVASLAAPSAALASGAGTDSAIICTPYDSYANFSTSSSSYVTTHAKQQENWTGAPQTRTVTTTFVASVEASVTYNTSVKASSSVVIEGLEVQSGLTLQASGTITNTSTETVTSTMNNQGIYIYYAGTKKASGSWSGGVCSSNGQYWNTSSGSAKSWTINIEGAVWCGGSRPSSGLGNLVYAQYC